MASSQALTVRGQRENTPCAAAGGARSRGGESRRSGCSPRTRRGGRRVGWPRPTARCRFRRARRRARRPGTRRDCRRPCCRGRDGQNVAEIGRLEGPCLRTREAAAGQAQVEDVHSVLEREHDVPEHVGQEEGPVERAADGEQPGGAGHPLAAPTVSVDRRDQARHERAVADVVGHRAAAGERVVGALDAACDRVVQVQAGVDDRHRAGGAAAGRGKRAPPLARRRRTRCTSGRSRGRVSRRGPRPRSAWCRARCRPRADRLPAGRRARAPEATRAISTPSGRRARGFAPRARSAAATPARSP